MEEALKSCKLCPRSCNANRISGKSGYCQAGAGYEIASIILHAGEEPAISGKNGICNVFFSHCNLQCVYCQNFQISQKGYKIKTIERSLDEVLVSIKSILDKGVENLGFVSPSHMIPQMKAIILALNEDRYFPIIVYNTNGYDSVDSLRTLEELVDVYLPDFKYSDPQLARKYSDAENYPEIAIKAIREMYRQKGNVVQVNENGIAEKGLIIRHLVLPGAVQNSINVLRMLAEEVSTRITISLMSQYHPIQNVANTKPLNRILSQEEYQEVVEEMEKLGFSKGWVQDQESADFYYPDFESETPFLTP